MSIPAGRAALRPLPSPRRSCFPVSRDPGTSQRNLLSAEVQAVQQMVLQDAQQNLLVSCHVVPLCAVRAGLGRSSAFQPTATSPNLAWLLPLTWKSCSPLPSSLVCSREKRALCCMGSMRKLLMQLFPSEPKLITHFLLFTT